MTDSNKDRKSHSAEAPLHGLLAEYTTPGQILEASRKIRAAGYAKWDTYTPFPVHGIDHAMGIRMTILPWIVLCAGLTGLATAIVMQWWMNAYDYPWLISGKPIWSIAASVPIYFELTVLFSAITTLVAMLVLNGLPAPSHPLDLKPRFARVTDDRFFLLIQASDPKFEESATRKLLDNTHPVSIEEVPEDRVTSDKLPTGLVYGIVIVAVAACVPFALAAKARFSKSEQPRIHVIGDMDWQPKYKAQRENPLFADGRSTRLPEPGTVAVGDLRDDDLLYRGKIGDSYATVFPPSIVPNAETIQRGKERFGIYCAPCHGFTGVGDGMVNRRAQATEQSAWVPPTNLTQDYLKAQPVGELFNSITNGIRNMPAYSAQIGANDRWAIIMYLRALQRSQSTSTQDLEPGELAKLGK